MKIHFTVEGKCSTFGGYSDKGVKPNEGLALVPDNSMESDLFGNLFRHPVLEDFGTARNLARHALYCAMRWDYQLTPEGVLTHAIVRVESQTGRVVFCRPCDWGPNKRTGRIIDLSPCAARIIGVSTDDFVTATLIS